VVIVTFPVANRSRLLLVEPTAECLGLYAEHLVAAAERISFQRLGSRAMGFAAFRVLSTRAADAGRMRIDADGRSAAASRTQDRGGPAAPLAGPYDGNSIHYETNMMSTHTEPAAGHALNEEGKAAVAKGRLKFARKTFLRGARLGHAGAQFNFGAMCLAGRGGAQDFQEAAKWFRKAAELGHELAQSNLAGMQVAGMLEPADMSKGLQTILRAANAGDAFAQFNAGNLYAAGDGVPEDLVEAYKWLVLALAQGVVEAGAFVLQIGVLLSPEERAVAHERIREFRSRNQ